VYGPFERGVQQPAERGDDDRPGAGHRALADDERRRVRERAVAAEHVGADVERVRVDAERREVSEPIRVAGRADEVLLEEEERPDRAAVDGVVVA
jgi:hypothetical protein